MSLSLIIFGKAPLIQVIEGETLDYDVLTTEEHALTAVVTQHPVEDGGSVSDHVISQPDRLTITGVVSNNPISYATRLNKPGDKRAEKSYEVLRKALKNGSVFNVETSLHKYTDLVMESLSVPRDVNRANSVEFTATFVQIRKVAAVEVAAPTITKDQGKKTSPTTPAETAAKAQAKSGMAALGDSAVSFFRAIGIL